MTKPKKTTKKKSTPNTPLSFEESLSELQQIVDELEDGSHGLEESMKRFEQGMAFLKNCYHILESAEQKIELLTGFNADGTPLTAPFDASATAEKSGNTAGRRKRNNPPVQTDGTTETETDEDEAGTLF